MAKLFTLLTADNPKILKGRGYGYFPAVLHLAPHTLGGRKNVCGHSTDGCRDICLNLSGMGGIIKTGDRTNAIQECRIRRTQLLFDDRKAFEEKLKRDLQKLAFIAFSYDMIPVFRPNGTSDLDWCGMFPWLVEFCRSLGIRMYDYTKVPNRIKRANDNYSLTFSLSENNKEHAITWLSRGGNVAVVFDVRKGRPLPATYLGHRVIDGDLHDLRFIDPTNVVIGLRFKGTNARRARGVANGFVIQLAA